MSKIQRIKINNFKAVSEFEADFKGCTALITGANNSGKSSFLRGLPDRIRFVRPEFMVKSGETEGRGELVLDNGERFVWEFDNDGKDKLTYFTNDGLKKSVTKEIGRKFFPSLFDIDKFLQSSPKDQVKQLQVIVGLDFTEIDERYAKAYNYRTERNREAEIFHVKLEKMLRVPQVDFVDLTVLQSRKEEIRSKLNKLYQENKAKNDATRATWSRDKDAVTKECLEFNAEQRKKSLALSECKRSVDTLLTHNYPDTVGLNSFLTSIEKSIQQERVPSEHWPQEPEYITEMPDDAELKKIDADILRASETNAAAQKYKEWVDHKNATEAAKEVAYQANEVVMAIESEKKAMIESVAMPEGIEFGPDGILVDGLPLDKNQLSTSKLYCAALRIAAMNLGEVKTLHFDASFLDKNTLAEIHEWAETNDLQLLIERPDFEAGEMRYEIIETSNTLEHEPAA